MTIMNPPTRRLVQSVLVSLNGVISEPMVWAGPHFGPGAAERSLAALHNSDAFLMGRRTYEIFSRQWPQAPGPYAERLNTMAKYVYSSTLHDPQWTNTTVIGEDPAEAVRRLKQQPGQDIVVYGHGRFGQTLIDADLVDELTLTVVPVMVEGTPLYQPHPAPSQWDLVTAEPGPDPDSPHSSTAASSGPGRGWSMTTRLPQGLPTSSSGPQRH